MEEPSINVLVDAKTEYTKQLTNTLANLIKEGFDSLYEDACKFKEDTNDPRYDDYSELQIFQDYLRKIPKWNQSIIDDETKRIINKSQCEWLEDLLAAVFISNAKVLSVIRLKNPSQQMKLKIPKLRNFIHKCYVECSREIYQNVYLFDNEEISTIEKQKNVRDIMNIVKEGIMESVRKLLPVREIIKTYLGKIYDDEETDNTTIETGFEQNLFMDFAKNNLRQNVEEIHSDTEQINNDTTENLQELSEPSSEENAEDEEETEILGGEDATEENAEEDNAEEDNAEEDVEELNEVMPHTFVNTEIEQEEIIPEPPLEIKQEEPQQVEEINLMNFKPKINKTVLPPQPPQQPQQQLSEHIIKQIEDNDVKPKMVYEKNEDETHYEVVSLAESDKSSEKHENDQELLKTIINKDQLIKSDNENTLLSTDENVKKIIINKDEDDQKKYEMEKMRAREERRRAKEERRLKRRILRNKDKRTEEQKVEQPMRVDDNRFMFVQNGAEYVEEI